MRLLLLVALLVAVGICSAQESFNTKPPMYGITSHEVAIQEDIALQEDDKAIGDIPDTTRIPEGQDPSTDKEDIALQEADSAIADLPDTTIIPEGQDPSTDKEEMEHLPIEVYQTVSPSLESCSAYEVLTPSISLEIPPFCCQFETKECKYLHNGKCMLKWQAGKCDYHADACRWNGNNWFCTCCAKCDGPESETECKHDGGVCRRSCSKGEYYAWWRPCSQNTPCRCCKKYCQEKTCANGRGICRHSSMQCPRGFYDSGSFCKGFGCKCCLPCSYDRECRQKKGFCDANYRRCPTFYTPDKCDCPDAKCHCCRPRYIVAHDDDKAEAQQPIEIQQNSEMKISFGGKKAMQSDEGYEEEEEEDEYSAEKAMMDLAMEIEQEEYVGDEEN